MKKVHFWEVDPEILRFLRTCPPGRYNYCAKWGVDHWKDGRVFYYVLANESDDWIEIIEKMDAWGAGGARQVLGVDDEEYEGDTSWPWV